MLTWLFGVAERLPRWSVPAVCGAIILAGIVSLRVLFALPALFTDPGAVAEAMVVVGVAAAGGAAGGLVYSFAGRPLLRTPRVGPYLTGIITVAGYLGALAVLIPFVDPDGPNFFGDPAGRFSFAFCVLFFGIIMGRSWFSGPDALGVELPAETMATPAERKRQRSQI
jgi:hypothetical protein